MEYRSLGRTGVMVSPLCLGAMNFGGPIDKPESFAIIGRALNQGVEVAGADRLAVRNRVSIIMPLPNSYGPQIARHPNVRDVTIAVWYGGVYQDERNFFPQYAIHAETYRRVYPEFRIPDDQWQAFMADRQACAVGRDLARRFGFEVGDRIPLRGTIFQGTWEFNVRAIYEGLATAFAAIYLVICSITNII